MNDSLRTNIFLRYSVQTIACSCIYIASGHLKVCLLLLLLYLLVYLLVCVVCFVDSTAIAASMVGTV